MKHVAQERHISFIIGSMSRGGAERVISILSNEYARNGWKVDIVMLLANSVGYELDPRINLYDFSGETQSRMLRLPYWLKSLRSYFKSARPDVVVSFAARINIITLVAGYGLGVKTVVSERNDPKDDGRGFTVNLGTRLLYPKACTVVFQTKRAMSYFPYLNNGIIIPNPISVSVIATQPRDKKIVTIGRLTPQKNQKMLIDAFAEIYPKFPEYKMEIYGEGELRAELQAQIDAHALQNNVILKGNHLDIHNHIKNAELFVLSSDYEGLSNALLEAMMMGLPCISTDCAGSDEYIEHDVNGKLVPVGDKTAMSKALVEMLSNDTLRKQMGERAAVSTQHLRTEIITEKWSSVICK